MRLNKTTTCLLAVLLLFTFASMRLPSGKAAVTYIEFLNHWTEPSEVYYWGNVTKEYNEHYAPAGYQIKMTSVEFDILYDTIVTRHAANSDPDIISMHAMWIPTFANWKSAILAVPPADTIQAKVKAEWTPVTVAGSTYKGIVWGFPSEFNSWGLVYDKPLLQAAGYSNPPTTWAELKTMAAALTKKDATGKWTQSGFVPFIEGMPEEQRYQFQTLLWSNGGEYLDLNTPMVRFNETSGVEVMQLYKDLRDVQQTYDPLNVPDYWWNAWVQESIAMIILPTWMTYVRDAMGTNFNHLAIAPIPIGPHGTQSISATYNWILTVTQKAEDEGRADAAWDFLNWISTGRPQGWLPLPGATTIGAVPKGDGCTIMGDYLIRDSIVPSRINDQLNGRLTVNGAPGPLLKDDFWFKSFMDLGAPPYGRSDVAFLKTKEVQQEIGQMFEKVTLTGADPVATVQETAAKVQAMLPQPGDINIDGIVDIYDVPHIIKDIDATPTSPIHPWNRGRSDINNDNIVSLADVIILSTHYGKTGGY